MSEPIVPTIAGFKVWLLGLPVLVTLVAFTLGIFAIPLRKGQEIKDLIYRIVACGVCSFLLGIPALITLLHTMPKAYEASAKLAVLVGLPAFSGTLTLIGCVMLLCSLPGPWIVGAFFMSIEKFKGRPLDEIVDHFREKEKDK